MNSLLLEFCVYHDAMFAMISDDTLPFFEDVKFHQLFYPPFYSVRKFGDLSANSQISKAYSH